MNKSNIVSSKITVHTVLVMKGQPLVFSFWLMVYGILSFVVFGISRFLPQPENLTELQFT